MAANSYDFGVNLRINADTQLAKQQLASLQQQLTAISSMKVNFNGIGALTNEISKASSAALTLQQNLQAALNPNTGNLNFSKFNAAIQSGGQTIDGLAQSLLAIGPQGNQAFVQLANSVARAEVPLLRTNAAVNGLWNNLKKTAGWQLSSSMIHGFIGGVQQAVGYAQALDRSLTNIRIVTGQSTEQMANFAKEANIAAKRLSTTTTDYTNASLIYYQQGLSDAEVKKRTDVTLKMANVSGQTAEKVADQMTSIWNNFDNGVKSIEYYADVMTALGAATASSSSEIAKGIQKFAAISDTVGLSYEYAASALATITATTRESADTVGNSLKTLFSRIQGLQLGDTLDDGTDLNKYSSALAKVGISIKNTNGELKDMDVILDDMGSKWHTLAEDQKMALAQTVGGVRQYTQIMTLMENWDFFKSNLGIARGSTGTLQEQMDVFEDSWLGAQKRMKSSWENLWDTLIDSEGFKELLNVGSTIVDNIAKAFKGLGGMGGPFSGGVLGLLTSSLGTIFNPQISHGVNSLLHNLGSLLPGARGRAEKQRMDTINSMVNTIMDPGQTPHMTQGQREVTAQNLKKLTQERLLYTQQQQYLTSEQQSAYSILDEQMSAIRTRQEETARLIDEHYAQRDRYAIGTRQYEDYYTRQFATSDTNYAQLNDLWKGMLTQVGLKGTELEGKQLDSVYNLASDFGVRSARALKEITTMTEDLSRGFKLPTAGEAARGITQGAEITADKLLFQSETGEVKVGGMAFDTMARFWGVSQDEHLLSSIKKNGFDFINEQNGFTSSQIALSNQLKANISEISSTIDKTYTASASQQAAAIQKTMNEAIAAGKTGMSEAFGVQQGANQENVSGIINSSQDLTLLSYLQKKDADNEAKIKEEQEKLLRRQQSFGAIATGAGLGISSAATALTSYESMIDSFKNGNTAGGITGLGTLLLSAGMYKTGMGNAISGIGSLVSSRANAFAEAQLAKAGKYLPSPGVLVTGSQAVSQGANAIASNAGNIAMGVFGGVIAYNELKKKFTKEMDTLKNESQTATTTSSQLRAAYQMSQNYQAAFINGIQEYSTAIEKLTNLSLQGAEKAAAIFDQNSKAYQLINDYNIDEQYVSRVNDIVKIDERALARKEEELIQKASVAKYTAEYSKYSANEANRKYREESLERSMGLDEKKDYNMASILGGVGAGALLTAALISNPVGWAILGTAAVVAGAGAVAHGFQGYNIAKQRDDSIIDAILKESEQRGNTSWINDLEVGDTVGSYTIDETQLEQIQQNQDKINRLYNDNKNNEIQLQRSQENIARDILNNNDRTQDFKYSRNMEAGLVNLQNGWYDEENLINYEDKSTAERVSAAKDVEEEMGLAGKNVIWTDDQSHQRLTYTYTDESGNEHNGELEYSALAQLSATAQGKEEADKYISNLLGSYDRVNTLYGEDAAAGVLSFITGQNFDSATQAQIAAAKKVFEQINFAIDEEGKTVLAKRSVTRTDETTGQEIHVELTDSVELAKLLGLGDNLTIVEADAALAQYATEHGYATINDLFAALNNVQNYESETMQLMQERFMGQEVSGKYNGKTEDGQKVAYDYSEWFNSENGRDIFGRMTESDMKKFYEQLNLISVVQGQEAGNLYLENLENILLNSGIDSNKIGEALSAILSLDWNDWNINESLVEILNSFGAELDILDPIIKKFTNNIRALSHSLPNLTEELTSLTQIAGQLENLKIGDSINESLMELLESKNISLEKETFSTWNGENVLIGDTKTALEGVRQEIKDSYDTFTQYYKAAAVSFGDDSANKSNQIINMSESDFVDSFNTNPFTTDRNDIMFPGMDNFAFNVLGREDYQEFQSARWNYQTKTQARDYLYTTDDNGNIITYWDENANDGAGAFVKYADQDAATQQAVSERYKTLLREIAELQPIITNAYLSIKNAAQVSTDPELAKKMTEQYVSTFPSFREAMADSTVRSMMEETGLTEDEMMLYYATKYPELTEYIDAYNYAMKEGTETQQEFAKSQLLTNIALQDGLAAYTAATGKKADLAELQGIMSKIQADMNDTYEENIGTDDLANMSSEAMVAADAFTTLSKNYSSWVSDIKAGLDPLKATGQELIKSKEALDKLGDALVDYLGLNDIKGITSAVVSQVVEQFIKDGGDISKIIAGDRAETLKLKKNIILASNPALARRVLEYDSDGNKNAEYNETYAQAIEKLSEIASKKEYADFTHTSEMSDQDKDDALSSWKTIRDNAKSWEEYQAAMEAGGFNAVNSFNVDGKNYTGGVRYDDQGNSLGFGYWEDGGTGKLNDEQLNNIGTSTGLANSGGKLGRRSGGGGGGPTKVQVKSAQDMMTRYKTTDDKMARAEMEKTAALQAKDLLYGEAKIRQLNRINGLLRKQQQLTADRIKEEMDYLKKDKEHLEEVLKRYNKDLKDDEKIELEFNNEGIITNYKQTIGKWAEELADLYRDGELTAGEGEKAKKLQKRIQDLQTVIADYEDSLNQLLESITAYEDSLYEMFSNQMEVLTYKVQYKLEMENDDLSYISFYADAIKDSMGQIADFIEFTGQKASELYDQIEVYNQGVADIIDFAKENPLQLWAAEGIEGMYTAEQIEALRQYRDGISSTYWQLAGLRKEVEEKVLQVFDYWNEKVEKGVKSISRYTDMLSQFKDIVNIAGREVLGLSDSFMATFEQQSIDQSMDNIKAAKTHYEALAKTYEDAQAKLAEAQAAGNEESIEHWQDVVDKTQKEMESAQDSMLTTLNHTLNMINEQFTNSLNEAIETFNEKLYEFNGLEGLIADYEQIREQQDLMVEDYEKIYNLSKLNRNLEKTLNDTKLIAGKQKLLEFQEKINEINKSNVELSRYELEYLQAEYELKLAEIELENARSAKDTVRLSKDNEGNWSYIYTQNEQAVDEAQQKYEDALFEMQQMSRDYTKEMNKAMMDITQQMNEEIAALAIQDFETPEAYEAEVRRIQEKYQAQLEFREQELNKSLQNNANLYDQDWANYSKSQGYKISEAEDWVDTFEETTLGALLGSNAALSDYTNLIGNMSDLLAGDLARAAATYFTNADKALQTYGTSLKGFKNMLSTTTNSITTESKQATKEVTDMADKMVNAFTEIADKVRAWQVEFGDQISELLKTLGEQIEAINKIIEDSDALGKQLPDANLMIGQKEAAERIVSLNKEKGYMSDLSNTKDGMLKWGDKEYTIVEFNGKLVDDINTALSKYANAKTGTQAREDAKQELNKLIIMYKDFRRIIELIYDATDLGLEDPKIENTVGMDTGGYTGEWGNEGKLAFLHEKELVLNKNDTANFLEALIASKDLINSMIEMNAHQSSLALGNLIPNTIQDMSQTLEQQVSIVAEFPNAVNHSEIEEAFDNIINMASQYANRPRD